MLDQPGLMGDAGGWQILKVWQKGLTLPGCPPHLPPHHHYLRHQGHLNHHHLNLADLHDLFFRDHLLRKLRKICISYRLL